MEKELKVHTILTWEEFRNFNFYSLYRTPVGIFLFIVGLGMWCVVISYLLGAFPTASDFPWLQLLFAVWMTLLVPIFAYTSAKKGYASNSRIKESITYEFDGKWIAIKGESFETKLTWDKIYKVVEAKQFFLIYPQKKIANILPKKDMTGKDQLSFREIVKGIPNLNHKLKG